MRNLVKKTTLFVFLSFVFSSLTGCSNAGNNAAQSNAGNAQPTNNVQVSTAPNAKPAGNSADSGEYPPVSSAIMQSEIEAVDAGNFKLEDKKGKVVLINLWGVWCIPCIKEMPHLIELQEKYRANGFEIIGLNVGDENGEKESAENIKKFAADKKLNYQLGWADEKISEQLLKVSKVDAVPQSFLIDREGRLNGVFVGGSNPTIAKLKQNVERLMTAN